MHSKAGVDYGAAILPQWFAGLFRLERAIDTARGRIRLDRFFRLAASTTILIDFEHKHPIPVAVVVPARRSESVRAGVGKW